MYLLFITHHPSGYVQTVTFPDAFTRALQMIALSSQPVTLRIQDTVTPCVEVELRRAAGSAGPVIDVQLVPKGGDR